MTWFFDGQIIESYRTSSLSVPQDLSPHFWVINSAVGGGYPGYPDQTTVFPNYHQVDYVRNYVWRPSCSGVTCSNHGCCKASTSLCVCDAGWAGANCEYNVGSASNTFDDVTSLDNIPNGWGNAYTLYLTKNSVISSGALRLTLTNEGCPSNCGNVPYSSGGWEGIRRYSYGTFTFRARPSRIPGTGFSLTAAGESTALEQIAFSFLGGNSTFVQLWTWTNNWAYNHVNIRLGFDASSQYHDYKFTWSASKITWYVDNVQVHESSVVMPNATRLSPGAYYTAQPEWYGAFSYSYPSYAYITNFAWQITPATASCN
jgi:beta-glucanase (GH16 family)